MKFDRLWIEKAKNLRTFKRFLVIFLFDKRVVCLFKFLLDLLVAHNRTILNL